MKNKKGFILADTLIALVLCCSSMMLVLGLKESELRRKSLLDRFDSRQWQIKMEIAQERRDFPVCTPPVTPLPEKEEAS